MHTVPHTHTLIETQHFTSCFVPIFPLWKQERVTHSQNLYKRKITNANTHIKTFCLTSFLFFSFIVPLHKTIKKTSKIYLISLGHTRSQQTSAFVHARNYGCMFMPLFFFALAVQTAVFRKWSGPCCLILHFQRSALMTAEPPAWQPAVGSMQLSSLPLSETVLSGRLVCFLPGFFFFFSVNTWCLVHSFFF